MSIPILIGAGLAALLANYGIHALTGYSPAYCLGKPIVEPIYEVWITYVNLGLVVVMWAFLFLGKWLKAGGIVALVVFLAALPDLAGMVFIRGVC
ncbi:MAG: hypothetical protein IKE42_28220 [Aquamicrobium sp.]|nr:hypothetical protein [Aquamicrobium sp.]